MLILRNGYPQVPPDSHGMSYQPQLAAPCHQHFNGGDAFRAPATEQRHLTPKNKNKNTLAHLGQVSELVGVQQQFLQTPSVAVDLIGHVEQRAVAFIDHLDMTVAPPQGYTVKHHGGGGMGVVVVADKSAPRAINKQQTGGRGGVGGGGGCNRLLRRDGPDGGEHRNCRVKVSCGNVTEQTLLPSRRPWELLSVFASLSLVCRHLFFSPSPLGSSCQVERCRF